MRIEELHLKNFRCFKELDIKFPKSNLAVFIGLNGAGKSAVLDGIYLSLKKATNENKNFYTKDDIHCGEKVTENRIVLKSDGEPLEYKSDSSYQERPSEKLAEPKNYTREEMLEAFKKPPPENTRVLFEKLSFFYDYINREVNWDDFEQWFEREENIENEIQKKIRSFDCHNSLLEFVRKRIELFLSEISDDFKNITVKRAEEGKYKPTLYINYKGEDLKIRQLSSGERMLIHLVGVLACKLAQEIDILEYSEEGEAFENRFKDYSAEILSIQAVTLIDEIELHLHPQWQREVLPALQKTFPNIQFIVTTHSPQVLSNLKKEEVFILKDNKISEFKPYVEGRDSNSILSEIFGVSERPKIFQEKLNEFYKAIDNKKLEEAKKLLKNLEEYWGTSDTEILKADLQLSFAEE